uniref:Putative capsid protein n=1 Tax=viral metagenome TaxID=1070528 RepID=A0A6M3JBI3_9ZZZZ
MPWKVFDKAEQGFCIFKLDADGGPTGKTMGCHETEEEAASQLRALYANVPEASKATIKAAGDWTLDVLGLPYGGPQNGRDSQGEYFSADTKWLLDRGFPELPPAVYYHGFSPEGKPMGAPEYIGRTVKRWADNAGIWYRVALDKASQWAKRVWDAAQQDKARASSGTAEHLRRVDHDGHIREWPVIELSLFDIEGDRQPANAYAVAIPAVKALYERAGLSVPDALTGAAEAADAALPEGTEAKPDNDNQHNKENEMAEQDMKAMIAEAIAAERRATKDAQDAKTAEDARIAAAVKAALAEQAAAGTKANRLPFDKVAGDMPTVRKFHDQKWDSLDAGEMALAHQILTTARARNWDPNNETFLKSMAHKAFSQEAAGDVNAHEGLKSLGLKTAGDIEGSTLSSYGDEWAGILYSSALWEKIRAGTAIVAKIPSIEVPEGVETMKIPIEGTDPTWYMVAQASTLPTTEATGWPNATITNSNVGTPTNLSLTPAKLGARVMWTGEMEEDSMVTWLPTLRDQLAKSGAEALEYVCVDGDTATTASTNINDGVTTPTTGDAFLLANGFRALAIRINTANKRTAGGLTVADYLETLKLMGTAGMNGADPSKTDFIIDPWVLWASLQLAEVQTRDVFSAATLENGLLAAIWGHKINVSYQMCTAGVKGATVTTAAYMNKSAVTGYVDQTTEANNAYGTILAVRWDQWKLGWKRRMTLETTRIARADVTEIVAMCRFGLVYRDTDASAVSVGVSL